MHRAAEIGYQLAARDYERVRPSYPLRSLGVLADALDLGPGKSVADLGAGTGKFTRLLALTGARVIAVEPVAAMRERLAEVLPQITVTAGLAEATGLPEHSVDVVVAAQAWHWFDAPAALAEARRVLRPGGALALVWNTLDMTVPWVAEYSRIYQLWRTDAVPGHGDGIWRGILDGRPGWGPLHEAHVENPYLTDREGVLGQALTSSVISALDETSRTQIRGQLEAVLDRHEQTRGTRIEIPYVTDLYWTRRLADSADPAGETVAEPGPATESGPGPGVGKKSGKKSGAKDKSGPGSAPKSTSKKSGSKSGSKD
ncbi:MAG TPA: class I SAM-dependent methyltransferase [Actinocrinis sp.]|nr:class I SAM-dependent methyltransferase [Actinocrinis sp.]